MPAVATMPVTPPKNMLVEQAANELRRGDIDMARNIATKAYNSDPAAKDTDP